MTAKLEDYAWATRVSREVRWLQHLLLEVETVGSDLRYGWINQPSQILPEVV